MVTYVNCQQALDLINKNLIKVTLKCLKEYKKDLSGSKAVLHISVGQEYHEGQKFLATIDSINAKFSQCDIMLCDTLQRHTLYITHPKIKNNEQFYQLALEEGDHWLERNKVAINNLKIPHKIYRWDYWLNDSEYESFRKKVDELYDSDLNYRQAIHDTINIFVDRLKKRIDKNKFDFEYFFKVCLEYLKEECAIIIPMWMRNEYDFIIYPRKRTLAMQATYDRFVKPYFPKLLRGVYLKFDKRSKRSPFYQATVLEENV